MDTHRSQRRRPTIAKDWQLAVLKKLQAESGNPTEEQRSAAAAETGLDEKWVRNWFTRQRSKLAARNRKTKSLTTEPRNSATVPTFKLKLQLGHPALPSRRSASTPVDPAPYLPSLAGLESPSPPSTANIHAISRSHSVPIPLDNPSQDPTPVPHTTTTIPTYSRDPLCNRYPDFSQFFRLQVHERFHTFELSDPVSNQNHLIQLAPHPGLVPHTSMHIQSLFNLLNPLHLGSLPSSSTNLEPCPVAFSMRLVDLVGHSSPTRYPPQDLGYHI